MRSGPTKSSFPRLNFEIQQQTLRRTDLIHTAPSVATTEGSPEELIGEIYPWHQIALVGWSPYCSGLPNPRSN